MPTNGWMNKISDNVVKEECPDRGHRESLMQINPEQVAKLSGCEIMGKKKTVPRTGIVDVPIFVIGVQVRLAAQKGAHWEWETLNLEPEPGVRFKETLNLEAEPGVQVQRVRFGVQQVDTYSMHLYDHREWKGGKCEKSGEGEERSVKHPPQTQEDERVIGVLSISGRQDEAPHPHGAIEMVYLEMKRR
ncbi:hypothetical protein B0H19DRAFT_1083651 [Mycena capillaripes]|nr:hypothetical protein B0H19DRAFT_1083651 [Mycena capillaripes]